MIDATENLKPGELATTKAIAEILRRNEPAPAVEETEAYKQAEARLAEIMKPARLH